MGSSLSHKSWQAPLGGRLYDEQRWFREASETARDNQSSEITTSCLLTGRDTR